MGNDRSEAARPRGHPLRALLARLLLPLGLALLGAPPAAADGLPPHPPTNVTAAYDGDLGTVSLAWDRSAGALRYEVGEGGTVVHAGGWDAGATLVAAPGAHAYSVRACSNQCGDWTGAASVTVGTDAPPAGMRYGGGFSDIVLTPNPYDEPDDEPDGPAAAWSSPLWHGEIEMGRGAYRASDADVRTLGGKGRAVLLTAYEPSGAGGAAALSGRFFVVSGAGSAVDRFSLPFDSDARNRAALNAGFFIATWDGASGWQARNDLGAAESFTPLASDVVVAIGHRASTADGIDKLKALVPDRPVPAGIRYGEGVTDIAMRPNATGGSHPAGDLRLSDGVHRLADGTERRLGGDLDTTLFTPFEPTHINRGNNSTGRFFVVSGAARAQGRFAISLASSSAARAASDAGFFLAVWDAGTGWQAINNTGRRESFTPLGTDVVVAVGHRATGASPGIDGLRPLVPRAKLSVRDQVLAVGAWADRLHRVELGRNLVTDAADLGSLAPIRHPGAIARVSDGVALVVDMEHDRLHRVEHTSDAITSITDLGGIGPVAGGQIDPQGLAHEAPGRALIADSASNSLLRVTYGDAAVTSVAEVEFSGADLRPKGLAPIGPGAFLMVDAPSSSLYRLDAQDSGFSSKKVGKVSDLTDPRGVAHLSEGVAVVIHDDDPDHLYRVEYSDEPGKERIIRESNLNVVDGLAGLNGLTALPSIAPPGNRAPSAQADSVEIIEDTPVAIDVLANDSDADGHALTVASVAQPSNGAAAIQPDGSVAYTPAAGFTGEDSFGYTASDGAAEATATVTVTVVERPLAIYDPDANTITVTVSEAGPVGYRIEVEETVKASETDPGTVTTHRLDADQFEYVNAMPQSGSYTYRVRSCFERDCTLVSGPYTLTVTVPDMFTPEPAVEAATVPGSLPYDVGVTKGGQAYVNVPVQPAPGVNGLAPRLSIDYGSGRERQRLSDRLPGDVLGYGWRVSGLSAIRRCLKNRSEGTVIAFGADDGLCLDGEPLVRLADGGASDGDGPDDGGAGNPFAAGTEYRTYRESYARVLVRQDAESKEPWFEVLFPDGRRAEYGSTDDSRLRLADGGILRTAPFLWSVKSVRDAYGNGMAYEYHENEATGVRHPLRIAYGSDGDAEVRFGYAARADGESATMGGQTLTENLLLHTVEVRLGGSPVRECRW